MIDSIINSVVSPVTGSLSLSCNATLALHDRERNWTILSLAVTFMMLQE